MARDIDVSDPSKLTRDDILYLQDRDRLPEGVEPISFEDRMAGNETELVAHATGTVLVPKDQVDHFTGRDVPEGDEDELPPYTAMSQKDLQDEAKSRKLPTTGSKSDLIARLEADDEKTDEV